jgi:hypothetical protein
MSIEDLAREVLWLMVIARRITSPNVKARIAARIEAIIEEVQLNLYADDIVMSMTE